MTTNQVLPPLRNKPYGGAWSIHDPESKYFVENVSSKKGDTKKFIENYYEWFKAGKKFDGILDFRHLNFSAGTTETFHMFYLRHLKRRLRLLKGEYFYHHMMARNYFDAFKYLDTEIQANDVVVMSCPFSNTGNIPKDFYEILTECDRLNVPVMLDLAYINISNINELNLDYKCITTITTSLSKMFPVEHCRIGLRLERELYDDPMVAYNQNDYVNLTSVNIGQQLIDRFDNDWLYEKYKDKQKSYCTDLDVDLSSCVIFGLDTKEKYSEYKRDTEINRLCFSRVWDGRINL